MNYMAVPGIPKKALMKEALIFDPEQVIRDCARVFGSTYSTATSKFRGKGCNGSKNAVLPRQLAMAIIKARTILDCPKGKGMPYTKIGRLFKGETGDYKDHSTVIHAINKVSDALEVDEDYRDKVDGILKQYNLKYLDIFRLANR